MYESLENTKSLAKEIAACNKQIELEEKKRDKQLEHNALGVISNQEFASMVKVSRKIIEQAKERLFELEEQLNSKQEFKKHIDTLRKTLAEAHKDAKNGVISRSFVEKYIDTIHATPVPGGVSLDIKLFTGKSTEKFLADIKKRWGKNHRDDDDSQGGASKKGNGVRLDTRYSNIVPVQDAMPL